MKFNNTKHIFFDLDHTLWDFDQNSGLAFDAVFLKNDIALGLQDFLEVYMPINKAYWRLYQDNQVTQEDLRYGRLKDSFSKLGITLSDPEIDQLSSDYVDHLPHHNHLLEGVSDVLEYLYPKYRLHIITNGFKQVQQRKLKNSGILRYFQSVTTSEDAGVKKPDQGIFEFALANASARIEESVMIGDNFEADILGASRMGMTAILYNYHGTECGPEYFQVLEMKELAQCL